MDLITSSGVSTHRRKGSGFHILFNCYPLPRPSIHEWFLFGTHLYLFLKRWDLRATCIVLVLFKQSALGDQYPNQLNQNSQGSQAETRNKQSKQCLDQNSHQLEVKTDCIREKNEPKPPVTIRRPSRTQSLALRGCREERRDSGEEGKRGGPVRPGAPRLAPARRPSSQGAPSVLGQVLTRGAERQ